MKKFLGSFVVLAVTLAGLSGCPGPQGPTASFTASVTSGTAPLTVVFTDTSNANGEAITAWAWNFGDGSTSTTQSPRHTYTTAETFTVSLTVTNATGTNTVTRASLITVATPTTAPNAAFSASNTSGNVPLTVQFTDQTTSSKQAGVTYSWNFGDGGTSTLPSPSHTYNTAGTFDVSLTVMNAVGSDTETKTGLVNATVPPKAPTADFTGTPRQGQAPLSVQLTDTSDPGTSPINQWSWNFNDGYVAGGTVDFKLELEYLDTVPLGAIGITESMPTGWTFNSIVSTDASEVPQTKTPDAGSTDNDLEIFWVNIPDLPLSITYRLNVPAGTTAPAILTGMVLFRQGGPQLLSNVETSTVVPRGTSTAANPIRIFQTPGTYTVGLTVGSIVGNDSRTRANYIKVDSPDLVAGEGEVENLLMTMTRTMVAVGS